MATRIWFSNVIKRMAVEESLSGAATQAQLSRRYNINAWRRLPKGLGISESQFRAWCTKKRYGIVAGYCGGWIVVRADTIPKIRQLKSRG